MTKDQFVVLMQQRVADGSIGPSTLRGMGPKGTGKAVKEYLRQPQLLQDFASAQIVEDFLRILNEKTKCLTRELPGGDRIRKGSVAGVWGERWGVARKCLNIFLYECIVNRCLCEAYPGLSKLEDWLEVPLDSYVGDALHKRGANLAWNNVIQLTPEQSSTYQLFALNLAANKKIARVHLDLEFYTERNNG